MLAAGVQQVDVGDGRVGDADAEGGARGGRGGRLRGRDGGDGEVGRVLGLLFFFSVQSAGNGGWGCGYLDELVYHYCFHFLFRGVGDVWGPKRF